MVKRADWRMPCFAKLVDTTRKLTLLTNAMRHRLEEEMRRGDPRREAELRLLYHRLFNKLSGKKKGAHAKTTGPALS